MEGFENKVLLFSPDKTTANQAVEFCSKVGGALISFSHDRVKLQQKVKEFAMTRYLDSGKLKF